MRKWIAILLLSLIPLQSVWAAVSSYCQHESGNAAKHIGHHDHQHKGAGHSPAGSGQPAGNDVDCAACHAGYVSILINPVLSVASVPGVTQATPPRGHLALPHLDRPERPNWARLA